MAHRSATVKINVDASKYIAGMVDTALKAILLECKVCDHYYRRRGNTLLLAVAIEAERHGVRADLLLVRYLGSVHERHRAGESLSTRPYTPHRDLPFGGKRLHVKRCCNGCGKELGDVRPEETDAAASGRPLPDTRMECGGCWTEAAA